MITIAYKSFKTLKMTFIITLILVYFKGFFKSNLKNAKFNLNYNLNPLLANYNGTRAYKLRKRHMGVHSLS
jgi:hypothetical protein